MQQHSSSPIIVTSSRRGPAPLIFSTTEIGDSWQRCEQSAFWGSLNGLGIERPLPGHALALGSLIHYTFADWGALYAGITRTEWRNADRTPLTSVDPVSIFNAHFDAFQVDVRARYEAWHHAPMDDSEWQAYEDEVGELGEAMISNYFTYYGSPFPDGCTLLAPEQTIVIPIPKVYPRQRQLYLEGTLDQLLLDEEGMLFPRDFKTYETAPSDYELEANDQFMTYTYMAGVQWPDYQVGGFAYDGLWKRKAITARMRRSDGSPRDESDLFKREYLLYSDEKIANHAAILPYRAAKIAALLRKRKRYGPHALDKHRSWATCPGCSFNDACQQLLDGDYGEWDEEAEQEALTAYVKRVKSPAWRVPLPELAAAA